jgi:CubicO group peptidase (beta-lactamase class C family)
MTPATVQGDSDPRFARVREEFERNFAARGERGAAVCVMVDGEPVVDLWGGVADPATGRPWERDTMNVIMSCSKGVTAACTHILIDRGELDIDRPVAHYWPEFAQHGKGDILVRTALSHQSGVAHVAPIIPAGALGDFDLMTRLTAQTPPYWEPGTRAGYHGLTIGWIMGELIRRVSGLTPGQFLRREICEPLGGLDCWIGLPEEHEHRVAQTELFDIAAEAGIAPRVWEALTHPGTRGHAAIRALLSIKPLRAPMAAAAVRKAERRSPGSGLPVAFLQSLLDPRSATFAFLTNMGDYFERVNTRASHAAEIPAAGAVASARGLAGVYAPLALGGEHRGVRLVGDAAIARMRVPQAVTDMDVVLGGPTSYTLGFSKSWPNTRAGSGVILGEDAFGTPGAGGQIGFADPSYRLSFAYVMNRHGAGTGLNERGQALVDAAYACLGSPGRGPGFWRRPEDAVREVAAG